MQQNPYQPGRSMPIPPPPPPPQQTSVGVSLPPPPPRTAYSQPQTGYQQPHGMVLPAPPSAVPQNQSSYWARQQTYPPPLGTNTTPLAYNPGAYQNTYSHANTMGMQYQQQMQAQQQQYQRAQDSVPLVSATYIPGSDSFGPGVGIPPLYTPQEEHTGYFRDSDGFSSATDASRGTGTGTSITTPDDSLYNERTYHQEVTMPERGNQGYISPGPPTAIHISPHQLGTSLDSQAGKTPISPSDPANQWTQDRVNQWLKAGGFSNEWQEAFKSLNIHGSQFLDLGRTGNPRNNVTFIHNTIVPQVTRESQASGAVREQSKEGNEGKRLRKMLKRLLEKGGHYDLSEGAHRRETSLPSALDGDVETSPNLPRPDGSTPTTAGTGDESPGRYPPPTSNSPASGLFRQHSSQNRQLSHSLPNDYNPETGRSTWAEQALRNAGDNYKRHSPSPSRGEDPNSYARQRHASPQQSPGLQSAHPVGAEGANGRHYTSGHFRTSSAEQSRRNGTDSSRPSPIDVRSNSNETPASAKDQRGPFWNKFRKKREDQPDESSAIESPTSPVNHRTLMGGPPSARSAHNGSQTSLPSAGALTGGVSLMRTSSSSVTEPKKYAFVTPDAFNYRLVDISGADSPLLLKQTVCGILGITYSPSVGLHITSPGQELHDDSLSDDLLMHARRSLADPLGTLKIYVHVPSSAPGADLQNGMSSPYKAAFSGKPLDEATQQRIRGDSNASRPSPGTRSEAESTLVASEVERMMQLSYAAEMHRQETERKQQAYLEDRRRHLSKAAYNDTPGIRGDREINFDTRRKTPYEQQPQQRELVPLREPPPVPPDTSTLIKANSLTKKGGQRLRQSWQDEEKRRSGEGRPGSSGSLMQSSPLRRGGSNNQRSGGADFDANGGESGESTLTQTTANAVRDGSVNRSGSGNKPALKVQTSMPHPALAKIKSNGPMAGRSNSELRRIASKRGPTHDFEEANVTFSDRNLGANAADSGDDSDDGLFAVQIRKTDSPRKAPASAGPTPGPSKAAQEMDEVEEKPNLTLRTNNNKSGFEPQPNTASTSTASPTLDNFREKDFESGLDLDSGLPTSATPIGWSPDEPSRFNRRESFASDIWANRPPAEALVEHLDEFFPNVNLDQPVAEESLGSVPGSPVSTSGPSDFFGNQNPTPLSSVDEDEDGIGSLRRGGDRLQSVAQRNLRRSGGLGRTKSIREVVQDNYHPDSARNSFVGPSRMATLRESAAGSIVRRKSTKMFGAKIEQIKPPRGSRLINLPTIPQDTLSVLQKQPTFKWVKGQLIGKGTFGRVYLGMNMTTGELIAVKQVEVNPKAHGQDKEKMKEMVRSLDIEIDTMKDLDHPNIVSYLGCERKDYSISIFLEYISGGSAGSCLRKHGKFEEPVVSSLTRQTLNALAYLHREGILHRDLKADNILLDLDGTCKISDFGISKKTDNIYGNDVTNSMQGSVFWMAPEVIRSQGQGYSAKVDIWSLGCVVLEMFAGRRPWSTEEAIGAIYKLGSLNEAPPIPDDVAQTISPGALSFMYDCFTIDPTDRPRADQLLRQPFCFSDPRYNFLDTELYAKIKGAFDMAPHANKPYSNFP